MNNLPSGWESKRLDELATIHYGKASSNTREEEGEFNIYGTGGIIGKSREALCQRKAVIIGRKGTIDKPQLALSPFWATDTTFYCLPNFKVDESWLFYALDMRRLEQFNEGSSIPSLSRTTLSGLKLPVPPYREQQQIAEVLATWDEAIRQTLELVHAKHQYKKGLIQRMITGVTRFPRFVKSERKQSTKFGDIPADWQVSPLSQLMKYISRSEPIEPEREYGFIGVRWYLAGAHIHSIARGNTIHTKTLSRIKEGDILYNKMWTTKAAFAVAKKQHDGTFGTSEYPQFKAIPERLHINYLEYAFHLSRFLHDATSLCRGSTGRARLNPKDFLTLEIPLPSFEEQLKIADVLQTCDREIELLQQKVGALQEQKRGLMQQLLTGRIRVNI